MIKGKGKKESHERNLNNDLFHEKNLKTTGTKLLDPNYIFSGKDFINK